MKNVAFKCSQTTRQVANKILLLRRTNNLAQEEFAEKVGLDRRTIARAEGGKNKPSAETMEVIALTYKLPAAYFFDDSVFELPIDKAELIEEINAKLNVSTKANLKK